jgi:flagellar motor switch protein FliM
MSEVLSQSEVESLLAALDPGSKSAGAAPRRPLDGGQHQISIYDFKRPERVSKDQMRAFQALHDGFSRELGAALSGLLRAILEVKLISVDQLTYSEFVYSLENPTCFCLLRSDPLEGHFILDVNPSIVFPILDRLLGGGKDRLQGVPSRPLTEIEQKLLMRIVAITIDGLHKSWANVCDLQLRILQIESNPQLVQIVPPNEVIVLISFELVFGEVRGIMNLCIPYNTIEPLSSKLSTNTWSTYTKKPIDPVQLASLETGLAHARVGISVQLAQTRLTLGEVERLDVGDVILTEKEANAGMTVLVEGVPKFLAAAGTIKGHKAIRILSAIEPTEAVVEKRLQRHLAAAAEADAPLLAKAAAAATPPRPGEGPPSQGARTVAEPKKPAAAPAPAAPAPSPPTPAARPTAAAVR